MIKFRRHKGSLGESMKTCIKFNSIDDMYNYIKDDYRNKWGVTVNNLSISDDEFIDNRIGWNHSHYVLNDGQCIGMCNIEKEIIK